MQAGTHLFNGDSSRASKVAEQARHRATLLVARDSTVLTPLPASDWRTPTLAEGRKPVRLAQTSLAHLPVAKDAMVGALLIYRLACVQALAGEKQAAVGTLETLLSIPFYVSPARLRIDPNFASLRGDSAFSRLTGPSAP
ncbi:MAG: hypothetical protein H0T58_01320 [Gemmatimonadales bacterium]|nr:hypothetical protein [Gemmatimonadales bacterium]